MKVLAPLVLAAVATTVAPSAWPLEADRRIANGTLSLAVSARDAGAVCSLVHDGLELVNDRDHGRQLQVAWIYNDRDEAYNPTEAGSDIDQKKPTSTSRLVDVRVGAASLTTVNHPAYWRSPGPHADNTADVTGDTLTKTVTLGFRGDPRIVVFETRIAVSAEPTGPPVASMRVEAPTLYAHASLRDHALFDLRTGASTPVPPLKTAGKDRLNEVIRHATDHLRVPVVSTPDGRHAVAMFTPRAGDFWAYYTHDVPSDDAEFACVKITAFFKHAAQAGRSYAYRTFLVVGDRAAVHASLRALPR